VPKKRHGSSRGDYASRLERFEEVCQFILEENKLLSLSAASLSPKKLEEVLLYCGWSFVNLQKQEGLLSPRLI
jgi:hypothetical protein